MMLGRYFVGSIGIIDFIIQGLSEKPTTWTQYARKDC